MTAGCDGAGRGLKWSVQESDTQAYRSKLMSVLSKRLMSAMRSSEVNLPKRCVERSGERQRRENSVRIPHLPLSHGLDLPSPTISALFVLPLPSVHRHPLQNPSIMFGLWHTSFPQVFYAFILSYANTLVKVRIWSSLNSSISSRNIVNSEENDHNCYKK